MTKQTDTSAEAVDRLVKLLVNDAEQQNVQPCEMIGLLPDDEYAIAETLCALAAERDEWKARASHTLANAYSAGLEAAADKAESMPTGIYPKEVAKAIRAQTDAEPGLTLADAYRAGLEAAAKRHVYYAHQYERINAMADAEAHMEHARQIRALDVPTEFGGE